jgi:hypothetical protein
MPESRSTALDPDLLTAEISLLLDYLSSLPERILTSHSHVHLPLGCKTYDDALARYFPIDEKVRRGETLMSPDIQFLLDLRDYLNSWAEPASGASIAFTTLVVRKSPEARKGKADAERAYPEWIRPARALRIAMMAMLLSAVGIIITIAVLAAVIYLGNSKIANIAEINAQLKSLDQEILRAEVATDHPSGTAVLSYCDDLAEPVQNPSNREEMVHRFRTIAQSHLCTEFNDLQRKLKLAYDSLSTKEDQDQHRWVLFPRDDRALPARLNVVSGYMLPVLMGLLGSMTFVLRQYLRSVSNRLLNPSDLREYIVRLVLGTVFGVAIGFFTSGNASAGVIAVPISSLGAPALAFVAGYGVEPVFRLLDGLAEQFSPARK